MPTISFNYLASLTSLREAPNGSIKRAEWPITRVICPSLVSHPRLKVKHAYFGRITKRASTKSPV